MCFSRNKDPDFVVQRAVVSMGLDILSLGTLILQVTTGKRGKHVHLWDDNDILSRYPSFDVTCIGQFKLCFETGLRCAEVGCSDTIQEIIETLKSANLGSVSNEDMTPLSTALQPQLISSIQGELSSYRSRSIQPVKKPEASHVLLGVLPRSLCFPLKPKMLMSSLLYLTNNTNECIAFRLLTNNPRRYHTEMPICGIVKPKCTYTLTVTMREQKKRLLSKNEEFLVLHSSKAREEDLKNVDPASIIVFFEKAKEKTNQDVQEMMLSVVCDPPEVSTSDQLIQLGEIIESQNCRVVLSVDVHAASQNYRQVLSVDVHPKEHWILTTNRGGTVCIWNYQKQETLASFEVSIDEPVYSAKFIERKNWIVTGDGDGYIHVYSYDTMEEVGNFEAHEDHIMCLAVNATYSFLLSASSDHLIKLWDWNKGWECMRIFDGHYNRVTQVMFNPKNSINFASASLDRRVKIWNIFSGNCIITLDEHPDGLICLHYFEDRQLHFIRQFLIAGYSDGTAKVWDPETHTCVGTLEGHTNRLNAICWLPKQDELLVAGLLDGTVQIWKPTGTTYRR